MRPNPVSLVRTIGNITVIAVVVAALVAFLSADGTVWGGWSWLIGGVALGYAVLAFAANLAFPKASEAAWDELNREAQQRSVSHAYWTVLTAFLVFLVLSMTGVMDPAAAFYWLGPILGIAPSVFFLIAQVRGRAG